MSENPFEALPEKTADGSFTLKLKHYDEQYHSLHGALQESQHVFIKYGLRSFDVPPDPVCILEVGLGTGLNAFLTGREALLLKKPVFYDAIEAFPLKKSVTDQLDYPSLFPEEWNRELFDRIHQAGPDQTLNIKNNFFIRCFFQKLQLVNLKEDTYHVVYFDAFGPDTQPEMWTPEIFEKVAASMKSGGRLVTYCVKGTVKRAMRAAGLKVEKLPGPPGKREMSRAIKP